MAAGALFHAPEFMEQTRQQQIPVGTAPLLENEVRTSSLEHEEASTTHTSTSQTGSEAVPALSTTASTPAVEALRVRCSNVQQPTSRSALKKQNSRMLSKKVHWQSTICHTRDEQVAAME